MSNIGHYERVRALAATSRFFVTAGHTDADNSEVVVFVRTSGKHQWQASVASTSLQAEARGRFSNAASTQH